MYKPIFYEVIGFVNCIESKDYKLYCLGNQINNPQNVLMDYCLKIIIFCSKNIL